MVFQADNQKHDMLLSKELGYALSTSPTIMQKIRSDDGYAQAVYAALCNTTWYYGAKKPNKHEDTWFTTWRSAGGIVADLQGKGCYLDWHCTGNEGNVLQEIEDDIKTVNWHLCKK